MSQSRFTLGNVLNESKLALNNRFAVLNEVNESSTDEPKPIKTTTIEASYGDVFVAEISPAVNAYTEESRSVVQVEIEGIPAKALIDSGSTAMIISERFLNEHQLADHKGRAMQFKFADGSVKSSDRMATIRLTKGTYTATLECYVLTCPSDLILGLPWLRCIDITKQNFRTGIFEFIEENRFPV
jgi:hypothetical protein